MPWVPTDTHLPQLRRTSWSTDWLYRSPAHRLRWIRRTARGVATIGGASGSARRPPPSRSGTADDSGLLAASVRRSIHQTRQWLLDRQAADGSWCAELEGDTILESETILLLAFLGHEDCQLARRLAAYLVEKQLPQGGWAMYPGGAIDISGSVKAYFALKLTGHDPCADTCGVPARRFSPTAGPTR